jgi:hypothetical protein
VEVLGDCGVFAINDVTLYAHTRNILLQVLMDKIGNRDGTSGPSTDSSERGGLRTDGGSTIIVMSVGGEAQLTQGMPPGSLRTTTTTLNLGTRQSSRPPSSHGPASPRASAASAARTPPPSTGSTDRHADDLAKSMGKVTPGGGVTTTPMVSMVSEWEGTMDSPAGAGGEAGAQTAQSS